MPSKKSFTLEEEYTPEYCAMLEAAYGNGMMSGGGSEGIEHMFHHIPLKGKKALDIGSGLGGVALYLAENYETTITGLDVNPWMIKEANRRIPESLKGRLNYLLSTSNHNWDLPKESFDLIYSKGVLVQVQDKGEIFQECRKFLKKDGLLVIMDWISGEEKKWGENIARLVELENLTMFPENESGYIQLLEKNGFSILSISDVSPQYQIYNLEIARRLGLSPQREDFLKVFDQTALDESIEGYLAIAKAMEIGELKTIHFVAQKKQ